MDGQNEILLWKILNASEMTIVRLRVEEELDRSMMMTSPEEDNEGDIDRPSTMTESPEVDDDDVDVSTMTATSPENGQRRR